MGLGDNRRSMKMRRRVRQAHKKARLKRQREAKRATRKVPVKAAPAKPEREGRKKVAP